MASARSDLVAVAHSMAEKVAGSAKSAPFRSFVRSLPWAVQAVEPNLKVDIEQGLVLRSESTRSTNVVIPITLDPRGLVPAKLEASLFEEDDVTFQDGSRRKTLSEGPIYLPTEFALTVRFGPSWMTRRAQDQREGIRVRVAAKTLTDDLINTDVICPIARVDRYRPGAHRIDNETLLELYPGVGNTPAEGDAFIGRIEEIEQLQNCLVATSKPSPVLLTGMRRVGKTSLLFALHNRFSAPAPFGSLTIYLSLAEWRAALVNIQQDVSSVIYNAIAHALGKRHFTVTDHNRSVGVRLQERFSDKHTAVRAAIHECRDSESFADSLMVLSERLAEWLECTGCRIIFLIDEAETLVLPYYSGGNKRLELEQLLQSLREVSQTSQGVGILLSGSNHINEFAREYKNAFFGSCVTIELGGIGDVEFARQLIAPARVSPFVQFDDAAIHYAIRLCAGMPQFMWQVGAATTFLVRSGPATRADVRHAVSMLINGTSAYLPLKSYDVLEPLAHAISEISTDLPFKPYDVLEPLEHMLALHGRQEADLLWLLLWEIANASSLVAEQAQEYFALNPLLDIDNDSDAWRRRLRLLVELKILEMPNPRTSAYRFKVPICAEAFRAPHNRQENSIRRQRSGR